MEQTLLDARRMTSRSLHSLLRLVLAIAALFAPVFIHVPVASAAIDLLDASNLPRLDAAGSEIAKRPVTMKPEGISRRDCDDDQKIRFTLLLDGFEANAALQVWAAPSGNDCAPMTARAGASQTCWQLAPALPLTSSFSFDARVRDIAGGLPPFSAAHPARDDQACGAVDLAKVSVQFLYFAPGDLGTPTWTRSVVVEVDTVGPPRPVEPSVAPRTDGASVLVSWEPGAGEVGSRIYCAPLESDAAGCALPDFAMASGQPLTPTPALDEALACAGVTGSTDAVVHRHAGGPLESDIRYVFARSAVDPFGNLSPLSSPACATVAPKPEGVGAYGSACSQTSGRAASPGAAAAFVAIAVLMVSRRAGARGRHAGRARARRPADHRHASGGQSGRAIRVDWAR